MWWWGEVGGYLIIFYSGSVIKHSLKSAQVHRLLTLLSFQLILYKTFEGF